MSDEIELKFDIDPECVDALEQKLILRPGAKGDAAPQQLHSIYYDTPALALRRAGFTLRIREVDGHWVQTVKAQSHTLSARGEWETALKIAELDLKAASLTPLAPVLTSLDGALAPVFATRVERTRRVVRQGKAKVEAALDRGEVQVDGRTAPLCELELELKSGETGALYDLARRLSQAAPLRLSFVSKSERGYRLLEGEAADQAVKGAKVRLWREMAARQAFQIIASACLRQWVGNAQVLRAARRPEALHQLRVALRRLRTAMTLFKTMAADDAYPKLDAELRWLTGELDQGRDIDVLIDKTFRPAAERFGRQAGMAGLGERLLKARSRAYDRILAALDSPRTLILALDMAGWIESGHWARPDDPLFAPRANAPVEALAGETLDRLRRQIKRRGRNLARLDPASRHKLRIRAKRLRYALEFFGGLYGKHARDRDAFLETLRALQDSLGDLNDLAIAREKGLALAESGGRVAGESETEGAQQAFAAGLMIGARSGGEDNLLARASAQYEALMDAKRFWR